MAAHMLSDSQVNHLLSFAANKQIMIHIMTESVGCLIFHLAMLPVCTGYL